MRERSQRLGRAYAAIPNAAMRDESISIEARGLLLLVDWSKCEVGDATIGRPEWVDWRLSVVAVPGPDGGVWRFQAERSIAILPYVNIWRRVT